MEELKPAGSCWLRRAVVTGTAAIAAAPSVAAAALDHPEETEPSGDLPDEVVVAWVRDAKRGEVTVVSGMHEKTYRDPALVKRLMAAAPKQRKGGGN